MKENILNKRVFTLPKYTFILLIINYFSDKEIFLHN